METDGSVVFTGDENLSELEPVFWKWQNHTRTDMQNSKQSEPIIINGIEHQK